MNHTALQFAIFKCTPTQLRVLQAKDRTNDSKGERGRRVPLSSPSLKT